MARYASAEYWDGRYEADPEPYDFFAGYGSSSELKEVIHEHVKVRDQILVVGAGTSTMTQEMFHDGYLNLFSIDFSPVCCRLLVERYEKEGIPIETRCCDVRSMSFNDGSFDVVVDKGTLDCLLCSGEEEGVRMLSEVSRVLHGSLVPQSHPSPCDRSRDQSPGQPTQNLGDCFSASRPPQKSGGLSSTTPDSIGPAST